MTAAGARKLRRPLVAAAIVPTLLILAVLNWLVPVTELEWHNVLHHLNIIPFLAAGLVFGSRGALMTLLAACLLQMPSIERNWHADPLDAQDQIVELAIFGFAGVVAGVLADAERAQRKKVEATKAELEQVYTELRESLDGMKRAERLAAAGHFATVLAHEIRNPLASISGAAGILARGQAQAHTREECLQILTKESNRLNTLLTQFLEFARPRLPRFRPADPSLVVHAVLALAEHAIGDTGIVLSSSIADSPRMLECDAEQVQQVLLNLVLNAIQASPAAGTVEVNGFVAAERYCVEVRDQGIGIPTEDRSRIFDPFFTTKENGTGLGLAVAANIVSQHHGHLLCSPNTMHSRGTVFRLELPFAQPRQLAVP